MSSAPQIWLKKTNKPPKKSAVQWRGHHFSPKTGTHQFGDSLNEHFACFHLNFSPVVHDYRSHPATFGYIDQKGKARQYTPDKLVISSSGQWIFLEVKPYKQWVKIKWQKKLKYLEGLFHSINCHFVVVLDTTILAEPRLSNLRLITAYARLEVNRDAINEVLQLVHRQPGIRLDHLCRQIVSYSPQAALIYYMLYHHLLACDLNQKINREITLTVNSEGYSR